MANLDSNNLVSIISEEQGHHPTLTTRVSGGLTVNDFIMVKIIDGLGT